MNQRAQYCVHTDRILFSHNNGAFREMMRYCWRNAVLSCPRMWTSRFFPRYLAGIHHGISATSWRPGPSDLMSPDSIWVEPPRSSMSREIFPPLKTT